MEHVIGIDFGTTNSVAAIYDGEEVVLVQLENAGSVMPSAIYLDKAWQATVGREAIEEYIAANMGRRIELTAEVLGESSVLSGVGRCFWLRGQKPARKARAIFFKVLRGANLLLPLQKTSFKRGHCPRKK